MLLLGSSIDSFQKKNKIIIVAEREKYQNLIAYSAINKLLRNNKILTPKLYDLNFLKGIMIVEDFGNSSFYNLIIGKIFWLVDIFLCNYIYFSLHWLWHLFSSISFF